MENKINQAFVYLNSYKKYKEQHEYLKRKLEYLKERLYSLKSSSDIKVDGGIKNETMLALIDKITEIENDINIKEMEAFSQQCEIENKLENLDYPFCAVLRKYFCENKSLEKISIELNYSYRQTKRLKKIGILKFEEKEKMSPNVPAK